jgi:hypothetical protein
MESVNGGLTPQKKRLWGILLGGIVGGIAGLFSGIACCLGYGLAGIFGTLVARAYLGDIKSSDGVKVGVISGVIGPLPGALLSIGFLKWITTLPTYPAHNDPQVATGMIVIYFILVFSAIVGIALSIGGALLAVLLVNYKKQAG